MYSKSFQINPINRIILVLALVVLPAVAFSADVRPTDKQLIESAVVTNAAAVEVEEISLSLKTDKQIYTPDERLMLTVTLKNLRSSLNETLRPASLWWNDLFVILYANRSLRAGETLYSKDIMDRINNLSGEGLPVGREITVTYHLNRLFDMTRTGTYKIFMRQKMLHREEPKKELELQSGVITIRVDEDQPPDAEVGRLKEALNKTRIPISDLECDCKSRGISLHLEGSIVRDITALSGFSIYRLILHNTAVTDLSPLKSCPVKVLSLLGSPVRDLSPLEKSGVEWLDLRGTAITNFSPLTRMPRLSRVFLTESQITQDVNFFTISRL